jgi:Raf kinase inhibitor-like YbhB/YbcL family protein
MKISTTAFTEGMVIPRKHTCDGQNVSPQLSWSDVPAGARSLALVMDDPDAPSGTFVHWILFDIPSAFSELREGVERVGVPGANSARKVGYSGPCPPRGPAHRYFFKLYALDTTLGLRPGASKEALESAMQGHILDSGQLMGHYSRS